MTTNLYHRINELVEEKRSLKIANERQRTRARLAEDRANANAEIALQVRAENTRLANENSSLKFAVAAYEARDMIDAKPLPRGAGVMHPTLAYAGTVAE